ncbi:MAG: ATP-binding protein, partial [Oscillospiraceae bacterium]
DYMDVALPISGGGNSYVVYIKDTRKAVDTLNAQLFMIILEALIIGLIISVLLSFLLSKSMIAPIERLTEGAERVAAGDFGRKLEVGSRDEIGVLTNTFNNMARVLKTTLDEIENERRKLDTLFLHMTDGVVAFSRDGSVIHKNPAAEQMLGREISAGDTYDSIFGDVYGFGALLALKPSESVELEHRAAGRDLELYLASFPGEEALGGVLAVIHDVTEQKKTEDVRREFVANVSHELRTPLTNIRSYTETLSENKELPPEMVASFLSVILNETDRMTRIVQDLLTLSRFDYGKAEMNVEKFSIYKSIENVYDAVLLDAQRRDHIILLGIKSDLPMICGDKARIEQVIMNVVSNALKYTPNGGTIRISAEQAEKQICITVRDNGIGIPEEDLPRVFERFYRVDKARSRESGGTGLGLAIAREIVLQHHGDITLESVHGEGTTVRIFLPAAGDCDE